MIPTRKLTQLARFHRFCRGDVKALLLSLIYCTMRSSDSFLVASMLSFGTHQAVALVVVLPPKNFHEQQRQKMRQQSNRLCSTIRHLASDPLDRDVLVNDGEDEEDDYDEYLRKRFERAKNDKLGAPIPPEIKRQRAKRVESEFLAAMQTISKEFSRLKMELGSDGAVEKFLEQIDDENDRIQDDDLDSIFQ